MLATLAACAAAPPAAPVAARAATPPGAVADAGTSQATPAGRAAAALVDAALAMLGQPYRFGGFAPGGFDCSGLVSYAARSAGIPLPRTAQEQLASGRPVARGELRAGDLVFMHLSGKELHVGIVVGEAHFVHAPSSGGWVRIDSLAAAPYAQGFLAARRLAD
jgi:cell wall-associated NlpC family hydrolase